MLLHCIIILKLDSTTWFFQRSKQVEITWCHICTVWRMCEHLQTRLSNFLCGLMSVWALVGGALSWWKITPCWSRLGGFPADSWAQSRLACTVVQAVVKANSQSNGNGQIRPPGSPKPLNGFRWNLEYVTMSGVWPHMQIHMALRQRVWSRRTRDLSHVSVS